MAPGAGFDFSIEQGATEWRWTAVSPSGDVIATGGAPSRRQAAACVIRAMIVQAAPADLTSRAPSAGSTRHLTPLRAA